MELLQVPYKKHTVQLASFIISLKMCTSFLLLYRFENTPNLRGSDHLLKGLLLCFAGSVNVFAV